MPTGDSNSNQSDVFANLMPSGLTDILGSPGDGTAGKSYEVFAHDADLRRRIESWEEGSRVEFLGQPGHHRGRMPFVVFDDGWIF